MMAAIWAYCAFVAATLTATVVVFVGAPPKHCRYMVPVKSVPGILACSQFPHAKAKP